MKVSKANLIPSSCEAARSGFSGYLDGAVSGMEMASISAHLDSCASCAHEFALSRSVQAALSDLGPARAPERLQARIWTALSIERSRGTHLPFPRRVSRMWHEWLGAAAFRLAGGLTAAILILGSAAGFLAGPLAVQANDDNMAHLVAPRYLYSQVPPQPLDTGHNVPVLVEAKVNTRGLVYDYAIIAGPDDPKIRLRVEENLLGSVFKPATAFGVPVPGHVIMTYSGVSVRG